MGERALARCTQVEEHSMYTRRFHAVEIVRPDGQGGGRSSFRIRDTHVHDPFEMLLDEVFTTEQQARDASALLNRAEAT
jgi:hypothetical protein